MKIQKKEIGVLHIITRLDLGGAQKVCLLLVEGLRSNSISTQLVSGIGGELASSVVDKSHVKLLKEFRHPINPSGFITDLRCFFRMVKMIKEQKKLYNNFIVHTHSTKAGIMGRWAAWFSGVALRVHTIHGYAFHKHQNKLMNLFVYVCEFFTSFLTTHFICVSSVDVRKGMRCFPSFGKKHSIIRAAVRWDDFYKKDNQGNDFPVETPFIFGTVASLKKGKNLFDLLRAFEVVYQNNSRVRLEIIGGGELQSVLEKWIEDHDLEEVVTLFGWQYNIVPIMRDWNCFAFSSLWEGLPCAIVEARLQKLPVISYITGGIPDVITHGQNGLLYEQKDWRSLADGMMRISKNKDLYDKLRSYKDDLSDFNDKQMIKHHVNLYKDLIQ